MNFPATFDPASFALGFVTGPVAYFAFGILIYSVFRTAKWLAAPFTRLASRPRRQSALQRSRSAA